MLQGMKTHFCTPARAWLQGAAGLFKPPGAVSLGCLCKCILCIHCPGSKHLAPIVWTGSCPALTSVPWVAGTDLSQPAIHFLDFKPSLDP